VELKYKLSDKKVQQLFLAGEDYEAYRKVEFSLNNLTPEARKAWLEMFGTATHAELKTFDRAGGKIWQDGSVSSETPRLVQWGNWIEQDEILTPETVSDTILALHKQYKKAKTELEAYIPKWQQALETYQQRKAEVEAKKKAEAEARAKAEKERKQRIANLPWVQQLTQKLTVQTEADAEIQRFLTKFSLNPKDITTQTISDKPYVRISATVPIIVAGKERTLEITNRKYDDVVGEGDGEAEFSDLCMAIAKSLAEIFKGEIQTVYNYNRDEAYLNVVTENDTINIATTDLEANDY